MDSGTSSTLTIRTSAATGGAMASRAACSAPGTVNGGSPGYPNGGNCAGVSGGTVIHSVFRTGKKSGVPDGTVIVRCTPTTSYVPARNHTCPVCPFAAAAPVVSETGSVDPPNGNEFAHSHHRALHSA